MKRRSFILMLLSAIGSFIGVVGNLFRIQVLEGKKYRELSERNYERERYLYPPRGDIYDRNGVKLAYDVPKYVLVLDAYRLGKEELKKTLENLKELFGIEIDKRKVLKGGFEPQVVKEELTPKELEIYYENKEILPGVFIEVIPKRVYPYGELASHILGYVGYPNERDFKRIKKEIGSKSFVGKMGIERVFDEKLLGELGKERVMVNAIGGIVKVLERREPKKGNSVKLTIDYRFQKIVEEVFKESGHPAGAVILLKASTGEVLALASFPNFNPNKVYEEWKSLVKNPLKPLFNRAIRGLYPPASVFKVPMAFATLSAKIRSPWEKVFCPGYYELGDRKFYCWRRWGHGKVDLIKSLSESCDVYYYTAGYKLGPTKIRYYAKRFSYGERIPFELPVRKGFIPTPRWKLRRFKEPWYDGDTVNMSIGQGFVLSNLMEQTLMMMGIANNGVIYKPTLLKEILDDKGNVIFRNKREVWKAVYGSLEHFALIKRGLRDAVRKGTAKLAFSRIVDIAGKTGTAEVFFKNKRKIKKKYKKMRKKLPWKYRNHAWFVGFAPYRDPKFVIGVFVEHGESGGKTAAPIARKILERIYIEKLHKEL
ncbi:penicillin-binding protein 2 [Aquifex aeolicus]|uniref:Penicillin binding protein 2 n=1 Tax=Aquifex aeolicus (strain VF5) TaxID=224324 RepID=O67249_AQUAE|nr:penicillin-binding protein 2 [Aquifex aeolicus]AAC07210.1 penicillin binding protein 2 [Aquifex aeolicus VF5]